MTIKDTKLAKQLHGEIRASLDDALDERYKDDSFWVWLRDFDETYVFLQNNGTNYRLAYSISDTNTVTFSGELEVVNKVSDYVVSENQEPADSLLGKLTKFFGGSKKNKPSITKQFDDESHTTIEYLYVPPGVADGVGDAYPEEDLEGFINSFNKANEEGRLQTGLFHSHLTKGYEVVKAWSTTEEITLGDTLVPKNQPLVEIKYTNPSLYELRKSGEVMGPSIGANCKEIVEVGADGVEKSLGEGFVNLLGKNNEELNALKTPRVIKRLLKGIHFDRDHPEMTLTDPSQGGACSLLNEIVMEKSLKTNLTKEQLSILDKVDEEFEPILKKLGSDNTSVIQTPKGNEPDMSELKALQEQLQAVTKSLNVSKVEKAIAKFDLGELEAEVAEALADVDSAVIVKAFDAIAAKGAADVEAEVEKAKGLVKPEENGLKKSLEEEKGSGEEGEVVVEKSMAEQAQEEALKLIAVIKGDK